MLTVYGTSSLCKAFLANLFQKMCVLDHINFSVLWANSTVVNFFRCLRIHKKYNANDLYYMRNIMSRIIRFIIVTFWPKTSSTVHLKKVMKQVCAWATLASKRVVLSRRGREQISEERNTGRGQEDEKEKTLKRLRLRGGWKKRFFYRRPLFFEEGEASEGRELEEDSNRQTQCHQVKLIIDDI